jgi:hypothetical protein
MMHLPVVLLPAIVTIGAFLFPFLFPYKEKFSLTGGIWFLGCWFYGLILK